MLQHERREEREEDIEAAEAPPAVYQIDTEWFAKNSRSLDDMLLARVAEVEPGAQKGAKRKKAGGAPCAERAGEDRGLHQPGAADPGGGLPPPACARKQADARHTDQSGAGRSRRGNPGRACGRPRGPHAHDGGGRLLRFPPRGIGRRRIPPHDAGARSLRTVSVIPHNRRLEWTSGCAESRRWGYQRAMPLPSI